MTLLILVALAIPFALGYLGIIGWRFDRGRRLGARDPFVDGNRADFAAPFTATIPPLPKEAFEDPDRRPDPS